MFFRRLLSGVGRSMFVIPTAFDYGLYLEPDRYTADQIPWQNMENTHIDTDGSQLGRVCPSSCVQTRRPNLFSWFKAKQKLLLNVIFFVFFLFLFSILQCKMVSAPKKGQKSSRIGGDIYAVICGKSLTTCKKNDFLR